MANIKIRRRLGTSTHLMRPRPQDHGQFELWVSDHDKFSAYVHADVLDFIKRNSDTAAPHETIGLLAGRVCHDPVNGPYTLVMAAENAVSGEFESSPGHVRLKAIGQTHLRRRLEEAHPDREIVGWYHSHPNCPPVFSHVDAHEQRTWNDQNSIGIVYSTEGNAAESFGVYRGPDSVPLRAVPDTGIKSVPALQPWLPPQANFGHLTPRPVPLEVKGNNLTLTPAARSTRLHILIVSVFALVCATYLIGLYRLDRRITFTEGRLHQLSETLPALERSKEQLPVQLSSTTSPASESSTSQNDGPDLRVPSKLLTTAPAPRQQQSSTRNRVKQTQPRRTARRDKRNDTEKAPKKASPDNSDAPKQTPTSATATDTKPAKEPKPKATPK